MDVSPPAPTPPATTENPTGLRVVAGFIDLVVYAAVYVVFALLFGESEASDSSVSLNLSNLPFVAYLVVVFGSTFLLEGLRGQTLGKMATGLYVMTEDGRQPDWSAILIRTILRLVDGLPVFYLVGFICVAVTNRHQRIGDLAAKTIVAKPATH